MASINHSGTREQGHYWAIVKDSSLFSKFLKPENLDSDNKWFCASCNCLTENNWETSIISSGSILVIQLSRFSTSFSGLIKDQQVFNCSPELDLKVPITLEDEVSFSTKYSLIASINHSDTLDQWHYCWAIPKDLSSGVGCLVMTKLY